MSRKADFEKISGDISLLYELSLAVVGSLDLNSACDRFLKILMARKNLAAAEVWIKDQEGGKDAPGRRARLVYALPLHSSPPDPLPLTSPIFKLLRRRAFVTIDSSRPEFSQLLSPRPARKGSVALFALERIGVLKLYRLGKFVPPELEQLKPVIDNFACSLRACLDHHRVLAEIRERKKTEASLRESEEKYRNLVERAQDGIVILQDGRIKFVNQRMARLASAPAKKMIGVPFLNYVASGERDRLLNYYRRRLAREEVPHIYETVLENGEKRIPAEINAGITIFRGRPADLIFVRDLTERKKLEEDILKAHKLESLGVLAGGIAHDFNNILTGILGNISLARLLLRPGEKQVAQRLAGAEKACLRARDLTRQLLTFSRGGAPIKEILSLPEFLRETVEFALTGSRVSYRINLAKKLWPVEADSGQLSQVVHNLILNAVQSMPEGGEITLAGENIKAKEGDKFSLPPGRYIQIKLTDQGIGIPEEYLGKIFDPYFTTKQEGSGLGLATVYSIITKHEGVIRSSRRPRSRRRPLLLPPSLPRDARKARSCWLMMRT